MATRKNTTQRNPAAPKVKVISESGATVNIGKVAKTTETVTVLPQLSDVHSEQWKDGHDRR